MTLDQQKYHFSSAAQDWETPQFIFDALAVEFGFTVDACAAAHNAKCERFWSEADNGMAQDWSDEIVWMNPPYNRAEQWMQKAWKESRRGATVVCLVPARTDSAWWHSKRSDVAPFPSALVIFRPPEFRFGTTPLQLEACRAV